MRHKFHRNIPISEYYIMKSNRTNHILLNMFEIGTAFLDASVII